MDHLLDTNTLKESYIIPPYARDIRLLLLSYLPHHSYSMPLFKSLWHKMTFSQIWSLGKPDDVDWRVFCREVLNCVLGYFLVKGHGFPVKLAALYALYFLYETQPGTTEQKVKIPLTPHLFYQLLLLREKIKEHCIYDAFHCLNRLTLLKAFVYTMHTNIDVVISCLDPPKEFVPSVQSLKTDMEKQWNWGEFRDMIQKEEAYWRDKEKFFGILREEGLEEDDLMVMDGSAEETTGRGRTSRGRGAAERRTSTTTTSAAAGGLPPGGHAFSRISPNLLKEVKKSIDDQLIHREAQLEILRNDAMLRNKEDTYISIEQLTSYDARRDAENAPEMASGAGAGAGTSANRQTARIASSFRTEGNGESPSSDADEANVVKREYVSDGEEEDEDDDDRIASARHSNRRHDEGEQNSVRNGASNTRSRGRKRPRESATTTTTSRGPGRPRRGRQQQQQQRRKQLANEGFLEELESSSTTTATSIGNDDADDGRRRRRSKRVRFE